MSLLVQNILYPRQLGSFNVHLYLPVAHFGGMGKKTQLRVAHEINNPLTNASLNFEMLKDIVGGKEKIDRKLESIDRNILRTSSIAQELLHFSRATEVSCESVNINDLIRSSNACIKD